MLEQAGQSIGVPELLRFDARCSELRLDEAKPGGWFLLILGAMLDLRGRCRREVLSIIRVSHVS